MIQKLENTTILELLLFLQNTDTFIFIFSHFNHENELMP